MCPQVNSSRDPGEEESTNRDVMTQYEVEKEFKITPGVLNQLRARTLLPFESKKSVVRGKGGKNAGNAKPEKSTVKVMYLRTLIGFIVSEFGVGNTLKLSHLNSKIVFERLKSLRERLDSLGTTEPSESTQSTPRADVESRAYKWTNPNPFGIDIDRSLPDRPLARLSLGEATELLGKGDYVFLRAMDMHKIQRYRFGFHPGDVIEIGQKLGGVFVEVGTSTVAEEIYGVDDDGQTVVTDHEHKITNKVTVDGRIIYDQSENHPSDDLEYRILYGAKICSELSRLTGLSIQEIEEDLDVSEQ